MKSDNIRLKFDLDKIPGKGHISSWYCQECGRIFGNYEDRICPKCGMKLEPQSRYAQYLTDALKKEFQHSRYEHRIFEKYQISVPDKEYFEYWDIFVWLYDKSTFHGCGRLIEVYPPNKDIFADYKEFRQPKVLATKKHFKKYIDVIPVSFRSYNECAGEGLEKTAIEIFKDMSQQLHRNISRNFGPTKIPDWMKS